MAVCVAQYTNRPGYSVDPSSLAVPLAEPHTKTAQVMGLGAKVRPRIARPVKDSRSRTLCGARPTPNGSIERSAAGACDSLCQRSVAEPGHLPAPPLGISVDESRIESCNQADEMEVRRWWTTGGP